MQQWRRQVLLTVKNVSITVHVACICLLFAAAVFAPETLPFQHMHVCNCARVHVYAPPALVRL